MRVLWLIDSLNLGGAEALVPAFARAVHGRADLNVAFLKSLGGNPFEGMLRDLGVPLTHLRSRNLRDVGAFRRLLRLVREGRFDVVHAHLTYAATWGALASRITGVPCVATLHTGPVEGPAWSAHSIRERLLAFTLNRWCSAVVLVSEAARSQHAQRGRLGGHNVCVIHNGVDVDAFAAGRRERVRAELGLAEGQPALLSVSALRKGKGLEVVLRAMGLLASRWPQLRLLIAGEGDLRGRLVEQARNLGIEGQVGWLGLRRDVADLLAAADVVVLASREDAFPTVLLEAMAAGRPIAATRVGGIPEIVTEGETGLLVGPGDPEALAEAIDALLRDPARAAALGEAGRRRARAHFSTGLWMQRLLGLYAGVVAASPPVRAPAEAT